MEAELVDEGLVAEERLTDEGMLIKTAKIEEG